MSYIYHGTMQDVIDYAELIKLQSRYYSKPKKDVCSRKSKNRLAKKSNRKDLTRKINKKEDFHEH